MYEKEMQQIWSYLMFYVTNLLKIFAHISEDSKEKKSLKKIFQKLFNFFSECFFVQNSQKSHRTLERTFCWMEKI